MAFEPGKVYAVWLREVKRFTNSKARVFGSMGMPILFLVALGSGFSAMMPGFNYSEFILPGILAMTVMFTSIFAGVSIIWDREFGFLKEMLAAPTSRETIVMGRILGGATTAIFQGLLMFVLGMLLTGVGIPPLINIIGTIALMTIFSCYLVALGITLASLVQEVETFQLFMNFLIMPTFFLSNALFPLDKMPSWMQVISTLNPMSYAVDGLRAMIIGSSQFSLAYDFGVSIIVFVVAFSAASFFFNRTSI